MQLSKPNSIGIFKQLLKSNFLLSAQKNHTLALLLFLLELPHQLMLQLLWHLKSYLAQIRQDEHINKKVTAQTQFLQKVDDNIFVKFT